MFKFLSPANVSTGAIAAVALAVIAAASLTKPPQELTRVASSIEDDHGNLTTCVEDGPCVIHYADGRVSVSERGYQDGVFCGMGKGDKPSCWFRRS